MANYSVSAYSGGLGLSQAQLLAWNGATVTSVSTSVIRMQIRDGGALGLPGDYDLILTGTFTLSGGFLTGGRVGSILGRAPGGATTLSAITGLSINLASLVTSVNPPAFSNPSLTTLFAGADSLTGGSANDTLQGAGGADSMNGGLGNDTFVFAGGQAVAGESINGGGDFDTIALSGGTHVFNQTTINGIERIDFIGAAATAGFSGGLFINGRIQSVDGSSAANTLIAEGADVDLSGVAFTNWSANDTIVINGDASNPSLLRGTNFADTINGGSAEDSIFGNGGADRLSGGASDDTFRFTAASQVASGLQINGGTQNDRINLESGTGFSFAQTTLASVERVVFFGSNQSAEFLAGQLGASGIHQFVATVAGTVTVNVLGAANLDLSGAVLSGFDSADRFVISGTQNADTITGSSANDTISGGIGADTLSGGEGDDSFNVFAANEVQSGDIFIGGGGTADTISVQSSITNSLFSFTGASITGVEHLQYLNTSRAIARFTDEQALQFTQITGGNNADALSIDVSGSADFSNLNLVNWQVGDRVFLNGDAAANTIVGTGQLDTINGGSGADTMSGGLGDDDFNYFNSEIAAGESIDGGDGFDRVTVANNHTVDLTSATIRNVEQVFFIQNDNTVLLSAAQIGAGAINDVRGGLGSDTLVVTGNNANLTSMVFFDWTQTSDIISIRGTAGVDTLTGSGLADILDGGLLGDRMIGGNGDDQYTVDNTGDFTDESTGTGFDQVFSSISFSAAAGIEQLTLAGTANINAIGRNGQIDTLLGNSGDNILNGLTGADTMRGGAGSDSYVVDDIGDITDETANGGAGTQDFVSSSVSFTAAAGIERLTLTGTANINAIGRNGQIDTLFGNSGNNILNGLTGGDTMRGGQGDDTYFVDNAGDFTDETNNGGGIDTVRSFVNYTAQAGIEFVILQGTDAVNGIGRNGQNDDITGNSAINVLNGLSGDDTLDGGQGRDSLIGGAGLDIFKFTSTPELDFIIDYSIADDSIHLDNAVFTLLGGVGALAANLFKNLALGAQDADDVIVYNQATGALFFDTNGLTAGGQVIFADVTNGLVLTASEFTII